MKQQLKYLKLFEGLKPDEIPYSEVDGDGDLSINIPKDVKELPPVFNELTDEVTWDLSIINNQYITSVTGFNKLTNVGDCISIEKNQALTSVTGFDNLTWVGQGLYIENNPELISVTGFNSLTNISSILWIVNNPKLVTMSIPGNIVRSLDYSDSFNMVSIYYDGLKFNSPESFINSPMVIDDLVVKFNPGYHSTRVVKQIIDNLEEWGTQDTKDKVYSHLGQHLTPEQLTKAPTHIQHLYHPDYKSTSGRDVAKFNTGQIYGIF